MNGRSDTVRRSAPAAPTCRRTAGRSPRALSGIDAIANERPAPEMMNEQVMGHRQLKAGAACPLGQVIVIEEPQPEPFIQPADLLIDGPLHEQAKPRQLGHGEPLPQVLVAPPPGKGGHLGQIAISDLLDQLRRRRIVGHGPHQADFRGNEAVGGRPRADRGPTERVLALGGGVRWGGRRAISRHFVGPGHT